MAQKGAGPGVGDREEKKFRPVVEQELPGGERRSGTNTQYHRRRQYRDPGSKDGTVLGSTEACTGSRGRRGGRRRGRPGLELR
eukprot:2170917-Rhodomonas_salina.2